MSPKYRTLDNRPINQWKVTELREELRRRKLNSKGLKDDLVKRLGECLRLEREVEQDSKKEEANGFDDGHVDGEKDSAAVTMDAEVVDATDKESTQTFETAEKGKSDVVEPIETENEEKFPGFFDEDSNKNDKQDLYKHNSSFDSQCILCRKHCRLILRRPVNKILAI